MTLQEETRKQSPIIKRNTLITESSYGSEEMAYKRDCFAAVRDGCCALHEAYCKRQDKCRFYKTAEQAKAERQKCYERLIAIGCDTETAQKCIETEVRSLKVDRRRKRFFGDV